MLRARGGVGCVGGGSAVSDQGRMKLPDNGVIVNTNRSFKMQMRRSGVLRKLRNGEVACSFKINLADPRSVDIAAMYGFDCVWLDMEHVPIDW